MKTFFSIVTAFAILAMFLGCGCWIPDYSLSFTSLYCNGLDQFWKGMPFAPRDAFLYYIGPPVLMILLGWGIRLLLGAWLPHD